MVSPSSVRFVGPLVPYVERFWNELMKQGYSPLSALNVLQVAAHVSRWLKAHSLGPGDLTTERVKAFAVHRKRKGYKKYLSPRAVQPLLVYLRGIDAAPLLSAGAELRTPVDRLMRGYGEYLRAERGLTLSTTRGCVDFARQFILTELATLDWRRLNAARISSFVVRESKRHHVTTQLRTFLRYARLRGWLTHDLTDAVPAVSRRQKSLPKGLKLDDLRRLLASCDQHTTVGCRDRAVLCLLARLGLRAGEVAALCLEDIDWRAGEVTVCGKGRRLSRLPLPADVGRTLVRYLRRRPQVNCRAVFLCARAPHRTITAGAVSNLAGRALRSIGITAGSAHVLRHTAATQMLRRGASLPEVAHVLRHRNLATTSIYAKVDDVALRRVARPWPGGVR